MAEGGSNLSAGTRQLVMLARAMLRRETSRLLLMDEATANCDYATDATIQRVVRTQFAASTLLTIAHRLDALLHSDRILVLDAGRLVEFGPPGELAERAGGAFARMLQLDDGDGDEV